MGIHSDDTLEPQLQKIFKKQLGFFDDEVLSSTINLISKGAKREDLERLLAIKLDSKKAGKLLPEVWAFVEEYNLLKSETDGSILGKRGRSLTEEEYEYYANSKKKKYHDDDTKEDRMEKDKRFERAGLDKLQRPPEKQAQPPTKDESDASGPAGVAMAPPSAQQIQEMLRNTQMMIEQRKKALSNIGGSSGQPAPSDSNNMAAMVEASSKAAKLAALQASIANKLQKVELPATTELPSKPVPLIIDASGRTVDASGHAIQLTAHIPTLKANLRAQEKKMEIVKQVRPPPKPEADEEKFKDPRISQKGAIRQKRLFAFHEAGKFQAEGQRMRMKAQLEKLQSEISSISKKTGISSATQLAKLAPQDKDKDEEVPDIEWWDHLIIESSGYDDYQLRETAITNLIEHPIQLKPLESNKQVSIPMFLTKKETKKLRRQNRREAWKEKQDKIRLGLIPPDEPKVKMSNLMRVLGNEQVLDPTKVEAQVRAQMAKRKADHEAANAERKLTPAQRKEKVARKLKEDTSAGVHVAVYRLKDLRNPAKKWKIEKNAQQLYMTGTVALYQDVNVVVVEGGPKQQKKFKQLLMHRIKWDEDKVTDKEGNAVINKCDLVWEGETKQRAFGEIKFKSCPTEGFARDHFKQSGVEHFWDQAYSQAVLEKSGE